MKTAEKPPAEMTDGELSEAVAVEVMGWLCGCVWVSPCGSGFQREEFPRFATDIAAAMEVFEKAGDDDHPIEPTGEPSAALRRHSDDSGPTMWSAVFMLTDLDGETFRHVEVLNESAPRAISIAALLWARARGV